MAHEGPSPTIDPAIEPTRIAALNRAEPRDGAYSVLDAAITACQEQRGGTTEARRLLTSFLRREHVYTRSQLDAAETHDLYWNAAMPEMVATGFIHNYMRMHWGKKILEWTRTPEYGYRTTLYLNNKYFLDGRDPSSFANVEWCYGLTTARGKSDRSSARFAT